VNEAPRYATLRDYLRVIRERRVTIILITLAFAGAALGWSARQKPTYEASATVQFKDENIDSSILGTVTSIGGQTPEQRAAISAESIDRPDVADRAKEILHLNAKADLRRASVNARPESRPTLAVVTARAAKARAAARLANAFAEAARDVAISETRDRYKKAASAQRKIVKEIPDKRVNRLLRAQKLADIARLGQLAKIVRPVEVLETASVPSNPVSPKPILNTILGLLLGLAIGLIAAFGRDALDRRFKNSREITAELHLPLVGYVREDLLGRSVVGNGRKPLTDDDLEGFRVLRTNLEFLDVDRPPKVVLITSALPDEGKSTVAGALACANATAGKRTLLVDCDLRRPMLATRMGLERTPGLTDYLVGAASPTDVLQTVALSAEPSANGASPQAPEARVLPLTCITAGTLSPQPAEMLRSQRFKDFLAQVSEVYDAVIVDSAPLLSVVDTLELLPAADAVVVCVRASQTTRDQARAARAALEHFPARPTGIVVTGFRRREEADAYGYYSYGYVYGSKSR
jgi:capsular exopolysaccharide synthesis family protein